MMKKDKQKIHNLR